MRILLLIYSLTLSLAVLLSERFERSILSAAVLFLAAGFLTRAFNLSTLQPSDPLVAGVVDAALFAVLFTDGMRLAFAELRNASRLPGRALLFGLPLTLLGTAALAHWLAALPWRESLLLGAILSPTDPVLVSAIVGREEIPERLRKLLQIESGLNDGLALPLVLLLLASLRAREANGFELGLEVGGGILVGAVLPWLLVRLEESRAFAKSQAYTPLLPAAVALLVYSVCRSTQANEYLAAFTAGVTLASISANVRASFQAFGELLTELLKLFALFLFGVLLSVGFFKDISAGEYLFAVLSLLFVRPAALGLALLGSKLPRREFITAAWFGPKGFASVVYALLVLGSGIPAADRIFHIAAIVVILSIVAHSSTDVPIARWLIRRN